MHFSKLLTIVLFVIVGTFYSQAQSNSANPQELSGTAGTVDDQFDFVIEKSNRYKDEKGRLYKVVRREWLNTLKVNTMDSIEAMQNQYAQSQNTITTQQSEINTLKTNLSETQGTLDSTNKEKDSMALFGMQMSKGGYNTLLWSVIGALFAFLMIFIFKFKNSNTITKAAKKALAETENEFEEHRRVALEREQKVRRELQDEINKHKGTS